MFTEIQYLINYCIESILGSLATNWGILKLWFLLYPWKLISINIDETTVHVLQIFQHKKERNFFLVFNMTVFLYK